MEDRWNYFKTATLRNFLESDFSGVVLCDVRPLMDVVSSPVRELCWRDGAHGGEFSSCDATQFCAESSRFESVSEIDDFGFVCVVEFFDAIKAPAVFVVSAVF